MTESGPKTPSVKELVLFSFTRTIINTAFRMVYPFLPALARGLRISFPALAMIVTIRSSLGLLGPLLGSASDYLGRKRAMLVSLILFNLSLLLVVFWPTYWGLLLAISLSALSKILFDPSVQAYLGDRIDYRKRGRAIAITELGWSLASLIGLPVVGWFIARVGWLSPFPLLASLGFISLFLVRWLLPNDPVDDRRQSSILHNLRLILSSRNVIMALGVTCLVSISNEVLYIVSGVWLEEAFGLKIVAIGLAASVIGLAELAGEGLVATITDRLGKPRAIILGISFTLLTCFGFPRIAISTSTALFALFALFVTFEFTFVSIISWMTELSPTARATLTASNLAVSAGGRALGAWIGPQVYPYGIELNSLIATTALALALGLMLLLRRVE